MYNLEYCHVNTAFWILWILHAEYCMLNTEYPINCVTLPNFICSKSLKSFNENCNENFFFTIWANSSWIILMWCLILSSTLSHPLKSVFIRQSKYTRQTQSYTRFIKICQKRTDGMRSMHIFQAVFWYNLFECRTHRFYLFCCFNLRQRCTQLSDFLCQIINMLTFILETFNTHLKVFVYKKTVINAMFFLFKQ